MPGTEPEGTKKWRCIGLRMVPSRRRGSKDPYRWDLQCYCGLAVGRVLYHRLVFFLANHDEEGWSLCREGWSSFVDTYPTKEVDHGDDPWWIIDSGTLTLPVWEDNRVRAR